MGDYQMSKVVMGIDQSFTSSGIVLINEHEAVIETFRITSNKENDIFARAYGIANEISSIVGRFNPDIIGLEGLAFSKFGDATRDLAGLQFVIVTRLRYTHKYDNLVVVTPNALKKYATAKGGANKNDMVDALPPNVLESFKQSYKKTSGLYDITDGYWIAKYSLDTLKKQESIKNNNGNES